MAFQQTWSRETENVVLQYLKSPKCDLRFLKTELCEGQLDEWQTQVIEALFSTAAASATSSRIKKTQVKRGTRSKDKKTPRGSSSTIPEIPEFRRLVRIPNNQSLDQLADWGQSHIESIGEYQVQNAPVPDIDDSVPLRYLETPLKKDAQAIVLAAAHIKKLIKVVSSNKPKEQRDNSESLDNKTLRSLWSEYSAQFAAQVAEARQECKQDCESIWDPVKPHLESVAHPKTWKDAVQASRQRCDETMSQLKLLRVGDLVKELMSIIAAPLEKKEYDGSARAMKAAECEQRKENCIKVIDAAVAQGLSTLDGVIERFSAENELLVQLAQGDLLNELVEIAEECISKALAVTNGLTSSNTLDDAVESQKESATPEGKLAGKIDRVKLSSDFSNKLALCFESFQSEVASMKASIEQAKTSLFDEISAVEELKDFKELSESKSIQSNAKLIETCADFNSHSRRSTQFWTSTNSCVENLSKKVLTLLFRSVQQAEDSVTMSRKLDFQRKVANLLDQMKGLRFNFEESFRRGEYDVICLLLALCAKRGKTLAAKEAIAQQQAAREKSATKQVPLAMKQQHGSNAQNSASDANIAQTKANKSVAQERQDRPRKLNQNGTTKSTNENQTSRPVVAEQNPSTAAAVWGPFARRIVAEVESSSSLNTHSASQQQQPQKFSGTKDLAYYKHQTESLQESLSQRNNYIMKFGKEKEAELAAMRHENHALHERVRDSESKLKEMQQIVEDAKNEMERQTQTMQQMMQQMLHIRQQSMMQQFQQYQAAQLTAQAQYTAQAQAQAQAVKAHSARIAGLTVLQPQHGLGSMQDGQDSNVSQSLRHSTHLSSSMGGGLGGSSGSRLVNPLLSLARQKVGSNADSTSSAAATSSGEGYQF